VRRRETRSVEYRLTNWAILDLQEIADYLSERSLSASAGAIESLYETFQIVAQNPVIGESLDHYRPGMRKSMGILPAQNCVVVYRVLSDRVAITRVLHAVRDWVSLIQEPID
jgi:plasmid stabilization system protein ParE